jgi:hypothetical protein
MNCVQHAHILTLPQGSFGRAAPVAYACAPIGQRTGAVDCTRGYGIQMSGDAKRTVPGELKGYRQHKFIGVEDNQ